MSETPNEKPQCDPIEPNVMKEEDSLEADQKKHDYYYDDSHGYETYIPDEDQVSNDELDVR